jgi:hypothetical protein
MAAKGYARSATHMAADRVKCPWAEVENLADRQAVAILQHLGGILWLGLS